MTFEYHLGLQSHAHIDATIASTDGQSITRLGAEDQRAHMLSSLLRRIESVPSWRELPSLHEEARLS